MLSKDDLLRGYFLAKGRIPNLRAKTNSLKEPTEERLGSYCLDFQHSMESTHMYLKSSHLLDENAVPLIDLGDRGVHYNPTRVAGYALSCFQRLGATGDEQYRETFLKQANWFVENAARHETGGCVWRYSWAHKELSPGWISAMAQGQAMSVLCRAYLLTQDQTFLNVACEALRVFDVSVERGGVSSCFPETGEVCYEEFPGHTPSRILNGWIFGLWGLSDLSVVAKYAEAEQLYQQGLTSLSKHLHEYDNGWWSYYDLPDSAPPRLASFLYHYMHMWMLDALAEKTGQKTFAYWGKQWRGYARSFRNRFRALSGKLYQRLAQGY